MHGKRNGSPGAAWKLLACATWRGAGAGAGAGAGGNDKNTSNKPSVQLCARVYKLKKEDHSSTFAKVSFFCISELQNRAKHISQLLKPCILYL